MTEKYSGLAAAIVLNGGPTPTEFAQIMDDMDLGSVDYDAFEPAFGGCDFAEARRRFYNSREALRKFISLL